MESAPLPDDALCPTCRRMFRDHPAVVLAIADRGLRNMGISYCACRTPQMSAAEERLERLLRLANLPQHDDEVGARTFGNFTPRRGTEEGLAMCREYAAGQATYKILIVTGQRGSGKSHLLEAVARETIGQGHSAKYEHVPYLLDRLRDAYKSDAEMSFLDVFERYQGADLLCLDDLGTEQVSPWVVEKLTMLIDERYRNGRRLMVATNLRRDDVAMQYHERLASRLWDRNTGIVRQVTLTTTDYRTQR